MAYNLPPPWDPGYALPDNVRDEGLERRGFVTKQMPRGTYDQPEVGTGGYVVPQYVMDEGYGQGTFVTWMEPRGEYDGPAIKPALNRRPTLAYDKRIPGAGGARNVQFDVPIAIQPYNEGSAVALSGDEGGDPFGSFGARSADAILARVATAPKATRQKFIEQVLGKIDPTLWPRTKRLAAQYVRAGASTYNAVRSALAQNMASGALAEATKVGKSRVAPQPASLLGLGCYAHQALGATDVVSKVVSQLANKTAMFTPSAPTEGSCSADGLYRFTNGAWSRMPAGQKCTGPVTSGSPVVNVNQPGSSSAPVQSGERLQVGPWLFPLAGGTIRTHMSTIPCDWAKFSRDNLDLGYARLQAMFRVGGSKSFVVTDGTAITSGTTTIDGALVGQSARESGSPRVYVAQVTNKVPIAKVSIPGSSKMMGLYLDNVSGTEFSLVFRELPTTWLESAFSWIAKIVGKIISAVVAAVGAVADLACQLVNNPASVGAAATAGGGAAAAGMLIAQQTACSQPIPVPPPPPPAIGGGFSWTPVLLVGGAVAAAAILAKKKAS